MDFLISAAIYAIDLALSKHEGSESETDRTIVQALKRSREVWNNISIHGVEATGVTFDEFCNLINSKKNVLFLTDEEMRDIEMARRIAKAVKEVV